MLEKTKLSCKANLHHQWENQEARMRDCRKLIEKYLSNFDDFHAMIIKGDMKAIHKEIDELSDEKQGKLLTELKALPGKSDILIGTNYLQALTKYKDYKKTVLSMEYKVEEHCDQFTSFVNRKLSAFENRIEAKSMTPQYEPTTNDDFNGIQRKI